MSRHKRTGSRRRPYREFRMESWEQFLKMITDSPYSNWAFRGQCDQNWHLFSALSRYFKNFRIDPRAWPQQEERILRIFKRKAHQFFAQPPHPQDDFQWLALMQHHGAPTRLLDLTWSPYVAAFFALERATGDAAVWALNRALIASEEEKKLTSGQTIQPSKMDPHVKGNFRRYFLQGRIPFVWVGEPEVMNRRLIAQSGTFALAGILDQPMEEILSGYPEAENIMAKFILPCDKVREIGMRELYRMNITYATLFPDLDGLARSLGYELEFHWAYDPRTMRSYSSYQIP